MQRLAWLLLIAAGILWSAAPALAAKGSTPPGHAEASITVVESSLTYGDQAHFTVITNATPTTVNVACVHEFGTSYGGTLIYSATNYTTIYEFGLYAPNWPSGGASCIAEVKLVTAQTADHWRVIGETGFVVAP